MRARRPSLLLRALGLSLTAPLAASLVAACGGPGASFPDRSDVTAAQAAWCQALSKAHGGDGWDGLAACKADYPAASAPFLKAMAKCFIAHHEAAGDKAYDDAQIAADCKEEVSFKMPGDDAAGAALVEARCRWTERCAKVPLAECKTAFAKLESSQRTLFTTMYNSAARQAIADCLDAAACQSDEDAAKEACYKPSSEKMLWLGH
ncbi:MAG: hypothetical protein U0359_10565 [Byssovorax sp.]